MDVPEYLKTVSDQIMTASIREAIQKELANHLEDQKDAFMEDGMEEQEAEEAAVLEMGDPVEVGLALNEIHKPKPAKWFVRGVVTLSAILFAVNVYYICFGENSTVDSKVGTVLALLVIMGGLLAIYYGVIAGAGYFSEFDKNELLPFDFPAREAATFFCLSFVLALFGRGMVFLSKYYFSIGLSVVFVILHLLFYHRRSKQSWWKCLLIILVFGICSLYLHKNLIITAELTSIYASIYTFAYHHNWFPVKKKAAVYLLWAVPICCAGLQLYRTVVLKTSLFLPERLTKNKWTYSLLPEICSKTGNGAAYLVLLIGIAAELFMIYQFRHCTNRWSKIYFLSASLVVGVMLVNGILTLYGVMYSELTFTPFLWKLIENHETDRTIDIVQPILWYIMAGYTTRFVTRDSVLDLEIGTRDFNKEGFI
ncbi:permease prefix domain 1-containing protein [Blautia schinkii]|nr:permease prefix domain 1-containing protein [Blautia schinkii]